MILTTAAFLTLLGMGTWIVGHLYGYQGIATIGAVIMVGVGAAAMIDGLETESGEERVEIDNSTTAVTTTYEPIGTASSFPTGLLLTLLGGVMVMRSLEGSGLG